MLFIFNLIISSNFIYSWNFAFGLRDVTTDTTQGQIFSGECDLDERIGPLYAEYHSSKCPKGANGLSKFSLACKNKQTCSLMANDDIFGDPCRTHPKTLTTRYICFRKYIFKRSVY